MRPRRFLLFLLGLWVAGWVLCLPAMAQIPPAAGPDYAPDRIEFYHVDRPFGLLGQPLAQPIQVRVLSVEMATALGGRMRHPVNGATVRFRLSDESLRHGASLEPDSALTDPGGIAATRLTLGDTPGTYVLEAEVLAADGTVAGSRQVRVLGGVDLRGDRQDARAGQPAPEPLVVYVEQAPGEPLADAEVNVTMHAGAARVAPERTRTNAAGVATFSVTPGVSNGQVSGTLQVYRPDAAGDAIYLGEQSLRFYGLNLPALLITVIGGLAIFIFGMRQLSLGLQLIAGDRLRQWLNLLTRNRFMGLMAGTFITGLIQSSSTTSVMVIGFVNAGLFQLKQAISVIFGANIGTTVTAQMISFNLKDIALPSIIIGVLMLLVGKREHLRNWAQVLIGFGLLFYGLEIMSGPLKGLSDSQLVHGFFSGLDCRPVDGVMPFWPVVRGVLVGTLVTVIIQSSSASIGLLLTLVGSGLIDVWAAFPILLGDNIGTTITAVLASIGANRTAKRVACSHVMFNCMGVTGMLALLYVPWHGRPAFMELVNLLTSGNAFDGENVERFLANAHSLFNVANALLFLPFIAVFERVAFVVVREGRDEQKERFTYLEPHLVSTPSLAIAQVYRELAYMSRQGQHALRIAADMVAASPDSRFEKQYERIQRREVRLDRLQEEILQYIQQISVQQLSQCESQFIPRLVQAVNDAERIGDQCVDILKLLRRMHKRGLRFAPEVVEELRQVFGTLDTMYERVLQAMEEGNPKSIDRVAALRKSILMMRKNLRQAYIERLEADPESIRSGVVFIEMITTLEGIADSLNEMARAYQEAFQWAQPHTTTSAKRRPPSQAEPDSGEQVKADETDLVESDH